MFKVSFLILATGFIPMLIYKIFEPSGWNPNFISMFTMVCCIFAGINLLIELFKFLVQLAGGDRS